MAVKEYLVVDEASGKVENIILAEAGFALEGKTLVDKKDFKKASIDDSIVDGTLVKFVPPVPAVAPLSKKQELQALTLEAIEVLTLAIDAISSKRALPMEYNLFKAKIDDIRQRHNEQG